MAAIWADEAWGIFPFGHTGWRSPEGKKAANRADTNSAVKFMVSFVLLHAP
jgi:hypothetical protein